MEPPIRPDPGTVPQAGCCPCETGGFRADVGERAMVKKTEPEAPQEILEQGNIYFLYRPKVRSEGESKGGNGEVAAEDIEDVQNFYIVLKPHGGRFRLINVGRKRLPQIEEQRPDYPKTLQKEFRGRKFATEDPRLLDYEGAEIIFIGARDDPEEAYHIDLQPAEESEGSADIFKQLRFARSRHPVEPLLRGEWR